MFKAISQISKLHQTSIQLYKAHNLLHLNIRISPNCFCFINLTIAHQFKHSIHPSSTQNQLFIQL